MRSAILWAFCTIRIAGFKFHKRRQLFIRSHNETLSVATMCVCNPDCFARENRRLRLSPNSNQLC